MSKTVKIILAILLFTFAAHGQQKKRILIMNIADNRGANAKNIEFQNINFLTNKLQEITSNVLPDYDILDSRAIEKAYGSPEKAEKACNEKECVVIGKKVYADYVMQAYIGSFNENLTIEMKLHFVNGNSIIPITGEAKNLTELRIVFEEKAYELFGNLPGAIKISSSSGAASSSSVSNILPPLIDKRDGKKYKVVKIGNQVWMGENLNYEAKGFFFFTKGNTKCYDDQESNCSKYGRLYDWKTAKKACPKGWHLPSNAEWKILTKTVSNNDDALLLKATDGWESEGNGTDAFNFSALPGGYCARSYHYSFDNGDDGKLKEDSHFRFIGEWGLWWTADESNKKDYAPELNIEGGYAFSRHMDLDHDNSSISENEKADMLSVRCVQD